MRVLHLVKTSRGAVWALDQMVELTRLGLEVHVALPDEGALGARYRAAGIVVHHVPVDLPVGRPWKIPGVLRGLRELVARVDPDLIHSHFVGTTLAMRLALGASGPPRVFQVPGPLHLEHLLTRAADLATARAPDRWIAACKWTRDRYLRSGVTAERVFFSHYGKHVDVGATPGKLRAELGVSPGTALVGMIAYVYPPKRYLLQRRGIKGHEDMIEAIAICLERGAPIVGVFVGTAYPGAEEYEARLRRHARLRCGDRAVFLGARSDVREIYEDFDVVAHPSLSENLGGAAESLLHGVPTIATAVGGLPDLVVDGVTGRLVPPRDPERLAEAILETLADHVSARRRARDGRARTRALIDVRRTTREVADIYGAIAA